MKEKTGLLRGLKLFDATTIVIGSSIGSGIFIAPSLMSLYVNSPGLILLIWIIAGILTICGALSFGELAAAMPKAGGQYVYLKEIYSPFIGFLCGWTVFMVIQSGLIAAVAVAFAKYMGVFVPWISEGNILLHIPLGFIELNLNSAQMVGIISILVLTAINIYGLKSGAFVQNLFTVLKVGCILVLAISCFVFFKGGHSGINLFGNILTEKGLQMGLFAAIAVATSKALFSYDAWSTVTFVAEEVQNPEKNLHRSLLLGTIIITLVYVITTFGYMYVIPVDKMPFITDNRVAAEVARTIFGNGGLIFISIAVMISTFGCNNGLILGGARILYAKARDGFFFKNAGEVHQTFRTPVNALIFQAVWASILTLTNTYSDLLTYTAFASLLFNSLAVIGVFVLRAKKPDLKRPYRVWGYPVTPLLYILISIFFMIFIIQGDPRNSGLGLLLICIGIPVYYFFKSKLEKKEEDKSLA